MSHELTNSQKKEEYNDLQQLDEILLSTTGRE